jgi:hypothetical protein
MPENNGSNDLDIGIDPKRDIVIKSMPGTDQLRIFAPMQDKLYCLGMLELAKAAVLNFKIPEPSQILQAPGSALQGLPEPDFQTRKQRR